MSQIIYAVLIVGGIGLIFGAILAFASFAFKVEEDERIDAISDILPGANCGGCGFAGCSAYASAIVNDNAPVSACSVGKSAVAEKIAEIMGVTAKKTEPMVAHVVCAGSCGNAADKYEYQGISDCVAANKLAGGAKMCSFGCLGLGSCSKACQFGAIEIIDGASHIIREKCTACGKCAEVCPKHIIKLIPQNQKYIVDCSSAAVGAATVKACKVGCVGCRICEKNCPSGSIKIENNHAVIDFSTCTSCGICAEKCPKKIIHSINF